MPKGVYKRGPEHGAAVSAGRQRSLRLTGGRKQRAATRRRIGASIKRSWEARKGK